MSTTFTRRIGTAVASLAAVATLTATPAVVRCPLTRPAHALPADLAVHAVQLTGTENTRTLAYYRAADGRYVDDLVIRSDNLSAITPADGRTLAQRRVRTVIDLRTQIERALQPDRPVPGATTKVFDVLGGASPTTLVDLSSAYRAFVTDPGARRAFRDTLLEIKRTTASDNSVLFHCSAGKDRTGWASAVLLTLLGVDRAGVERDYLASNTFRHTSPADRLNGVNIAWLRTAFATADRVYGSFDNYVRRGLRLTSRDIAALKSQLLKSPYRSSFSVLTIGG